MSPSRFDALRLRAAVVRAARAALDQRGFLEVQTPLLVPGTCPDRAIASFPVAGAGYLVSSTEYQLKRLFSEGLGAAYTLGPNFRQGEVGERHNPEFTMLEWGRAGATMAEVERECEAIVRGAGDAVGKPVPTTLARRTVRELIGEVHGRTITGWEQLRDLAGPLWADPDAHCSWLVDQALSAIDPDIPTWIVGWPAAMTTSAGLDSTDPTVTQRSELYWRGLELSDGFPFCRDAAWQRRRSIDENVERRGAGEEPVQLDERFLDAVGQLPEGAGMALGVDRLCMALLERSRIDEVLAFSWSTR